MNKKDENKLRNIFLTFEKEKIIDLYLQLKWELDIKGKCIIDLQKKNKQLKRQIKLSQSEYFSW